VHTLSLSGTSITDEGLRALSGMQPLTTLSLKDTKVTDAGVRELTKALPKLKIER
jgi:hypothetical protein